MADLRGGVLRGGAPPRVTQNGIFLLAPTLFEFGNAEQQNTLLPRMAAAQDLWCQGWSEPGAGSDLAGIRPAARSATSRPAAGGCPGRRPGPPGARSAPTCSGCSAPTRPPTGTAGLTYFLVPLDTAGVTVRGFGRLDGDEGFAEVFFDDVFVPDDAVSGGVSRRGGRRLAGGDGHHRLRARPDPALARPVPARSSETGRVGPRSPGSRRAGHHPGAWSIRACRPGLPAASPCAGLGLVAGRQPGARSSLNKLYWSELDIALHAHRTGPARPRRRAGRAVAPGLPVLAGRADLRRHQRDPAQHRRRAGARPAEEVTRCDWHCPRSSRNCATWWPQLLADRCPPSVVRTGLRVRWPPRWPRNSPTSAPAACWCRRSAGGLGLTEDHLVPVLTEVGRRAVPLPLVETWAVAPAVLAALADAGRWRP